MGDKSSESSGGFFSWFTGGSSSPPPPKEDPRSKLCPGGCGMQSCNCNCALREHLKQCCGLGQLPPLITKDTCPVPRSASVTSVTSSSSLDNCTFLPVDTDCKSKQLSDAAPATACSNNSGKPKCSIPNRDVSACIPGWVCPPTSSDFKTYRAPVGEIIRPISANARTYRNMGGATKCGQCGTMAEDKGPVPKVSNLQCPMMVPRCAEKKPENDGGFFAKLGALFGGGKK